MNENILEAYRGGTALFLGRVTHFTEDELERFIREQGMSYTNKYENQTIDILVLSTMMTPAEEEISYALYEAGVPDITLAKFEHFMSQSIKPNSLLMSLKLSGDQQRLRRLLGNEALTDSLYLELFKMMDWGGEGIHETDANRDATISFVKRFFRPEGFRDPAMVYAPTTVMIIAKDSDDPAVLEAILAMPNHEIKVSRNEQKKPKNLREMVAFNPHLSEKSIKKLLAYGDPDIDYFLASNVALSLESLERIYQRADSQTKQMMTQHAALPDLLFARLLAEERDEIAQSLLSFQTFDEKRLALVWESPHIAYLGTNIQIGLHVEALIALENEALDKALASNPTVGQVYLEQLYARHGKRLADSLASNPNMSPEMAQRLYETNARAVIEALAANESTPLEILDVLCALEDRALNRFLASNASVGIDWLRQFQLDTSLIRILAENKTYGEHILRGLGL